MAGTTISGRLTWVLAEIQEIIVETPRTKSLVLSVPGWSGYVAGQHVDIRLTAEDGYQVERSYSVASAPAPGSDRVELTVERLNDGEVSPYLTEELRPGDRLELRGPIGGYFTWDIPDGGPLLLVGGGSGVVPLMAMIRHRIAKASQIPTRLLLSSRDGDDIIYRDELARLVAADDTLQVSHTLTRAQPAGWTGFRRRIDAAMLAEVGWPPADHPRIFVCGPTQLVETVASTFVTLGHPPARVKTERFGPTGG
ncbi:MAG: ferredoxin reductase [Thermomicrobiales bacterium]